VLARRAALRRLMDRAPSSLISTTWIYEPQTAGVHRYTVDAGTNALRGYVAPLEKHRAGGGGGRSDRDGCVITD